MTTAVATAVSPAAPSLTKEEVQSILDDAVSELVLEDSMGVLPFKERVAWRIKPGFNTAAWAYSAEDGVSGAHTIYMGDLMFTHARPGLTREQYVRYAKAYGTHERDGHARRTTRGKDAVKQLLRPGVGSKQPIPFPLFNLFEDARIEYKHRNELKELKRKLGWREFEPDPEVKKGEPVTPSRILFLIVQSEADERALEDTWLAPVMADNAALAEKVMGFYTRIVAAESCKALRPLMLEWLDEFPPPQPPSGGGESKDGPLGPTSDSELELGYDLGDNPGVKEAFDADTKPVGMGAGDAKTKEAKRNTQGKEDSVKTEASGSECVLATEPQVSLDTAEVGLLAKRLQRAFRSPTVFTDCEDSTPDLCLENLLSPDTRASAWQRPQRSGRPSRYRLAVVVDCSGSMKHGPMDEARKLCAALSLLARRGVVEGFVLLTAVMHPRSVWYKMKLPVAQRDIERMHAFAGAEGIEAALRDNVADLAACQRVFLYSDGCITDRQPDKAWLRSRGIEVVGLYCGTPDKAEKLSKHVQKVIIRDTPLALADAMVKSLKGAR